MQWRLRAARFRLVTIMFVSSRVAHRVEGCREATFHELATCSKNLLKHNCHGFVIVMVPAKYLTRGFNSPRRSPEILIHLFTVDTVKQKG